MQFTALFALMVLSNAAALGAILVILWRTERFLTKALVYMKARGMEDVLSASSLLDDKRKSVDDDSIEVVPGQDDDEFTLANVQKKHREHHVKSLGAE